MTDYKILAIDTSCDETSAAVTCGERVLSNALSSQTELHKKYGGVVPILAQRAHRERIEAVILEALKRSETIKIKSEKRKTKNIKSKLLMKNYMQNIDVIAVTVGPGLAPALEVGIAKAKELAVKFHKPLIAVNHMEGHLLSAFAKNSKGRNPNFPPYRQAGKFPMIGLLVSGGHTELVLMNYFGRYQMLGETLDDALGEAFDKAGRILDLGYPGGPIIEKLAKEGDENAYYLPIPMQGKSDLNFSYSGLKTALLYLVRDLKKQNADGLDRQTIVNLCASFQKTAAASLIGKLSMAVKQYKPKGLLLGGGVMSNLYLRRRVRAALKKHQIPLFLPFGKNLYLDNAAMIGVCAYYQAKRRDFAENIDALDRLPGLKLGADNQELFE